MALIGIELETLVSELDALTTRPPLLTSISFLSNLCCPADVLGYNAFFTNQTLLFFG